MRKKEILLTCILPIILTIILGIYLDIAERRAHEADSLNCWTIEGVSAACPSALAVPGNRAASTDSKDFVTRRRGVSDSYAVALSDATRNLLTDA
jgi:hypothetical protein